MLIHETLVRERCFHNLPGNSKKRILENASELIAESVEGLEAEDIFAGLISRERLGSTGIGEGVAIPHCRLDNCTEAVGALVNLPEPVDFDAIDGQPVDLLFVLLVPTEATETHLQTLASLAELFSQADFRQRLRQTHSADELYKAAADYEMEML
ncbi:PTS IIA-like nitrogen regulatory protein PtsN [Motiliproteus sp. SC1-56]|uniref:PTS IIA-like nitrogen regulatory protein PtsN n=1 Tax=Motiliproteus sp. SC1-56 TaxID=2799565 RepID=UPI001A8DF69C|nr:PTS IIA-like nitrogen regulatory protein PtsN [Motiliproteus sp. SC1-56]